MHCHAAARLRRAGTSTRSRGEDGVSRFAAALQGVALVERAARVEAEGTVTALLGNVTSRSRSLLLLIELFAFHPWDSGVAWHNRRRAEMEWSAPSSSDGDGVVGGHHAAVAGTAWVAACSYWAGLR